ncbi:cell division protein FtsQ/DivIB [Sporosarcina highlanderae]|uniref:Cell division protein DivIB n=1 Tax=Sporosarcina highlanderae TaxID=3035916 RepID=A0ABT8JQW6_9BACL|nr:cell division protein FtsQ/DivIB [Sporosarcina highlanderae]MDN4607550.1 FtsQ-type POTRA domain-containing protein [Sporosarcina highlanderae]
MDKVIDIEERIPSMREKRRRKTNKKFIFIIAVFCIALLVLLYFQSPFSKVGAIEIHGAQLYDDEFYFEKSGIPIGSSYWGFVTKEVEKELLKIEGVSKVSVTRKLLRDVEISITEWKMVAYMENDGNFDLLLENGELISSDINYPNVPILNHVDKPDLRKKLTKQLLKMDKDVLHLISEIIYTGTEENPDTITAFMDDGFEVHAIIPTFAEKMDYYPEITSQLEDMEKGIIDMEVGTYFSPFNKIYGQEKELEMEGEGEGEGDVDGEENE